MVSSGECLSFVPADSTGAWTQTWKYVCHQQHQVPWCCRAVPSLLLTRAIFPKLWTCTIQSCIAHGPTNDAVVISSAALLLTTNHVGERFFSESHRVTSKRVLLMDAQVTGPVAFWQLFPCRAQVEAEFASLVAWRQNTSMC